MSATLMGAVMICGPNKGSMRYVLVAIADNADDFGFACPSISTIADKACCDERTAMRLVQSLEREGWLEVRRRVLGGKGSVYFLNLDKLGASVGAKSRKSPLHVEVEKMLVPSRAATPSRYKSGDKMSRESVDVSGESGDNSQRVQVTKTTESGDKTVFPILKNRCEPLLNPNKNPQPPSKSKGASGSQFLEAEATSRNATSEATSEERQPAAEAIRRNAAGSWESGRRELLEAAAKVLRERDISDPRMEKVVIRAIVQVQTKCDDGCSSNAIAERMIARSERFELDADLMRHTVSWRKFFSHGLWDKPKMWPYDEKKLNQIRRL